MFKRSHSELCAIFLLVAACLIFRSEAGDDGPERRAGRTPVIDPDYRGATVPPNIAPLNFRIEEPGSAYRVLLSGPDGPSIRIRSNGPGVRIPENEWKALLRANPERDLTVVIDIRDTSGVWMRYRPFTCRIASEPIDSHVAYRLIHPGYVLWWDMGLYQRDFESFTETAILTNRATKRNCMNCHAFCKNDPRTLMFHMRAAYGGTMFIHGDTISKVNTGTDVTLSAGVYPSWHPDGTHVAYSVNKIRQLFHSTEDKSIHVWDSASDIVVYDARRNVVTTSPRVCTKRLENLPAWSADGKVLYFVSADPYDPDTPYDSVRYNLMRIPFDSRLNAWGEAETVIDAARMKKSISWPRPSPDGRYVLFTMSDYGYFSIHFKSSDLFLLDLRTGRHERLDSVNSPHSDSYHSWSSNSRWFVFASKRRDGLCSRLYFSYVDSAGRAHKPVLLPQEDPDFYNTFVCNYNVPELITGPVDADRGALIRAALGEAEPARFDPAVNVDALSGATAPAGNPDPPDASGR